MSDLQTHARIERDARNEELAQTTYFLRNVTNYEMREIPKSIKQALLHYADRLDSGEHREENNNA